MRLREYPLQRMLWGLLAVALVGVAGAALWIRESASTRHGTSDERPLEGLKNFGTVPDFSLIERSGRRVGLSDLRGKVWVANFIYTHCVDTCPLQSAQIAQLQRDFEAEPDVRFISISVDPEQDTPDVLVEYAERYGADRDRWLFLTGDKAAIYRLAQEGFRLSVVDPEEGGPPAAGKERRPSPAAPNGVSPGGAQRSSRVEGLSRWVTAMLQDRLLPLLEPAFALAHQGHAGKPFIHSSRFVLVDRQGRIRGYYQSDDMEALKRLRRDIRILVRERRR